MRQEAATVDPSEIDFNEYRRDEHVSIWDRH